jgi:hypothetical protein
MQRRQTQVLMFLAAMTVAVAANAQTTVTLPDSSQTTTLDANVSEQAHVTVPATVSFAVNDVTASTAASAATITVNSIVLATATKQLRISLQAAAPAFTPPVVGATTWSASDVSWNAATWTGSTSGAAAGTLSDTAFGAVVICDGDVSICSTSGLIFSLAAKTTIRRSGLHALTVNWKLEAIGT